MLLLTVVLAFFVELIDVTSIDWVVIQYSLWLAIWMFLEGGKGARGECFFLKLPRAVVLKGFIAAASSFHSDSPSAHNRDWLHRFRSKNKGARGGAGSASFGTLLQDLCGAFTHAILGNEVGTLPDTDRPCHRTQ